MGVPLTLDPPSDLARTEAAGMGFYKPDWKLHGDDRYDRYQILTVDDLCRGKQPEYPPFRNVTFKAAPEAIPVRPRGRIKKLSLPGFPGQGVRPPAADPPEPAPED